MAKKQRPATMQNPVAKYAGKFQQATVFRDRTKYRRNNKHKGHEPFSLPTDTSQTGC